MCGILGEFGNKTTPKSVFYQLLSLSKNRGPDMVGYENYPNIQFGFNRLSIIDISDKANQPIKSPSGRYFILCNGEIINFRILKKELELKSSDLRSTSDIEILSLSLDKWGINKTLKKIRGMFALAIFDDLNKKLFLARDPAGIKPLYVGKTKKGIIFASQYDQIFKHEWFKNNRSINNNSLSEYLKMGYIPSPLAFFKNSWMVGPGEVYEIDLNQKINISSFYSYEDSNDYEELDKETLNIVENKLISFLQDYLESDVPIATFLSGGIDSTLLNSLLSTKINNLKAYTFSDNINGFDESENAKKIANHLKIKHEVENFKDLNINRLINDHFYSFSEPFADYSSLPIFKICQIASASHKVMISGDGADELFWGYTRFIKTVDHKNWFKYNPLTRRLFSGLLRRTGRKISSGIECKDISQWVFEMMGPFNSDRLEELLPGFEYSEKTIDLYSIPHNNISSVDLLKWQKKTEFYGHMQRRLLKVDRASMWNGVEVRVPYLDQRLIDLSLKIKPSLGIKHRNTKYLLKKILYNYVPKSKLNKEKQGFEINLADILRKELKEEVQDLLLSKNSNCSNMLNQDVIDINVNKFMKKENDNTWQIWALFSLEKFLKVHNSF